MLTMHQYPCRLLAAAVITCCGLLVGCAQMSPLLCSPCPPPPPDAVRTTIDPERLTKDGTAKAMKTLEEIIARPPVAGITDEALYLLALFNLRSGSRDAAGKAQHHLHRLGKEYPQSPWNQVGQPVLELLDTLSDQRRQIASLKNQNQTLSKETRDLHQAIEQLKNLDLELEKKSRR